MGMRVQRTTSNFASLAKRVFWHCIIVERVEQDAQAAFSIVNDLFQVRLRNQLFLIVWSP